MKFLPPILFLFPMLTLGQMTPQQTMNAAAPWANLNPGQLQTARTYFLAALNGGPSPQTTVNNDNAWNALDSHSLDVARTYFLSLLAANGQGASLYHTGAVVFYGNVELALSNAVAGDSVVVWPGNYNTTNGWIVNAGVHLTGIGPPTVYNYNTNLQAITGIYTYSGTIVNNFVITNAYMTGLGANGKQSAIGFNAVYDDQAYTNIIYRNLIVYGESDGFYGKSKQAIGLTEYDCSYYSQWDAQVILTQTGTPINTPIRWDMFNCQSIVWTNQGNTALPYTHSFGVDFGLADCTNVIINHYGGLIVSTNNGVGNAIYFAQGVSVEPKVSLTVLGTKIIADHYALKGDDWGSSEAFFYGCNITGAIYQDDQINLGAPFGQVTISGGSTNNAIPNGMQMSDSVSATATTWTNKWGTDGGLTLGNTNLAGKANLFSWGNQLLSNTNSGSGTFIDFNHKDHLLQTNAAFAFRGFQNIPAGGSATETTWVTNTTGSTFIINVPLGISTNGGIGYTVNPWNCTNLTKIVWEVYQGRFTNGISTPMR